MSIKVKIDGTEIVFPSLEQQPLLHGGRTYVPVRALFEHMGYEVTWTPGTGSNPKGVVRIEKGEDEIIIGESSSTYSVNGNNYNHPDNLVPMIVGGRLMIPIRGVLESVGYFVDWDNATETVIVKTYIENLEGYFKIKNSAGQYLTYISPPKNDDPVLVASGNNSDTQIWKIEASTITNKYHIKPAQRTSHSINIYRDGTYPCTMYKIAGNIADTSFSLDHIQGNSYAIKWDDGTDIRSLASNGSNTYWNQSDTPQSWTLVPTNYTMSSTEYEKAYPVDGYTGTGITYFGHSPNARDFQVPGGTAIYATMSGTVIDVVMNFPNDYNYNPDTCEEKGGASSSIMNTMASYGNYVKIQVDIDGTELIYAHQNVSNYVHINDKVVAGQKIGEVGNTGCSTGYHMHFEANPIKTPNNSVYDYFLFD